MTQTPGEKDQEPQQPPPGDSEFFRELELPPPEVVDRVLDLQEEDRAALPGLFHLNVVLTPTIRIIGLNLLLAVAILHNLFLRGGVEVGDLVLILVMVESYSLGSWLLLRLFFAKLRRIHLGTVFLVADLLVVDAVLLFTGGTESLLWPVLIIHVADQLFTGRRRPLGMLLAALGAYGLLLGYVSVFQGREILWGMEVVKLLTLGGLGAYLALAAGIPWGLQERAHRAKDMILKLEEQTVALNRERKRAEEASRAKSEFLARMSHELRTPLNSVIGFTNVLSKSAAIRDLPKEADYLGRVRENGMHLLALINDVLDISRIEEGSIHMEIREVELGSLVESTVAQLEGRRLSTAIDVRTEIPSGPLPIQADEARLRQVLINLVGNALKFTETGSIHVRVETDPETGAPRSLHVVDTGMGISAERLEHIFQPFEQEDGTTSRRHSGTGLGLAISTALCELMGFRLTASSEPGAGSTFMVLFQKEEDPEGIASPGASESPQKS